MNKDYGEFFGVTEDIGDWANLKLPDPSLLDYYKRLENREILINQNIDDGTVEWTQEIIQWNREDKDIPVKDRKPIKIFINSNGGSLNSIMELITICNLSKTPVYAIGMGKCYSAGGLLLMGVPKGNRYILNTTEALEHLVILARYLTIWNIQGRQRNLQRNSFSITQTFLKMNMTKIIDVIGG